MKKNIINNDNNKDGSSDISNFVKNKFLKIDI